MPKPQLVVSPVTFAQVQLEQLAAKLQQMGDGLPALDVLVTMRELVEEQIAGHAAAAAVTGSSWQQVGDVMGVSRQSAWERYGRPGRR